MMISLSQWGDFTCGRNPTLSIAFVNPICNKCCVSCQFHNTRCISSSPSASLGCARRTRSYTHWLNFLCTKRDKSNACLGGVERAASYGSADVDTYQGQTKINIRLSEQMISSETILRHFHFLIPRNFSFSGWLHWNNTSSELAPTCRSGRMGWEHPRLSQRVDLRKCGRSVSSSFN